MQFPLGKRFQDVPVRSSDFGPLYRILIGVGGQVGDDHRERLGQLVGQPSIGLPAPQEGVQGNGREAEHRVHQEQVEREHQHQQPLEPSPGGGKRVGGRDRQALVRAPGHEERWLGRQAHLAAPVAGRKQSSRLCCASTITCGTTA